ncbi:Siderophore synthetase component [Nitrosomonas eutropha]|uniref:IucA/IucC family protein n=1 Tax=Nitrosomonas eutropha TaxID=916 RepID=UPI00089D20DD|nr:IucA/IucC family protein [Nitrosomonas eutropha]SDX06734.1 Siderophore synthetase component [Nitrosomonas eutropha]
MDDREILLQAPNPNYLAACRRTLRQLLESMLFENILEYSERLLSIGCSEYAIKAIDANGKSVSYLTKGVRTVSYGRIRLQDPVIRISEQSRGEALSIALFLGEIAPEIDGEENKYSFFISELNNTVAKNAEALRFNSNLKIADLNTSDSVFDAYETAVFNGHLYHPCYKSRMGFNLEENQEYTNDFGSLINLTWLAIRRDRAKIYTLDGLNIDKLIADELQQTYLDEFARIIINAGKRVEDYIYLPVHPWQWKEKIVFEYVDDIANGDVIFLGSHTDKYSPQQSLRSLSNQTRKSAHTVKIALSIINTSADRLLSPHNVANSAIISQWLASILQSDLYLKDELRFNFIKEVAGIYDDKSHLPEIVERRKFGLIGTIWRESIHTYLQPEEFAIPATALCFLDSQNKSVSDDWIAAYGLQAWTEKLLDVLLKPFIHLLYAHGIGFEAHAQNTILFFRDGLPVRVAVRDLPGGIRFARDYLQKPASCPMLLDAPKYRLTPGERSVLDATPQELVWYLHDAIFFVHLAEIARFLHMHQGLDESEFWKMASRVIEDYQDKFPELDKRYNALDLFQTQIRLSQFSRKKIFADTSENAYQHVMNPLKRSF